MIYQEIGEQAGELVNGQYIALLEMTVNCWKVLFDFDNGIIGVAPHLEKQLVNHLFP